MSGTGRGDSAHGALGPVEAAGGTEVRPGPARRPGPTRRQWYGLAALLLTAGVLLAAREHAGRPAPEANSPPPYPSQAAAFSYLGPLRDAVPGGREFTLKVRAAATGRVPYAIVAVRQEYRGISTSLDGTALPATVGPGRPAELTLVYRVTDCAAAPRDAGMPLLDVTLRNTRAIQTVSQILGADYARDLSRNLHIICPDTDIRTSTPVPAIPDSVIRYPDTALITRVSEAASPSAT
ncbi:hypothetical protein GCM10009760_39640 [Kitasatospora kazusensis]|uniref:Tat pathway signal sequence domain protein n=1 Tax=Kitasatospora kazusensis TaxID=407974 RepID=A0ABP5LIS3_9ACTN